MSKDELMAGLAAAHFAAHNVLWTDGWFLWSLPFVNPTGPVPVPYKNHDLPTGHILAARAFTNIEFIPITNIPPASKSVYDHTVQTEADDDMLSGLHTLRVNGFEPIEVESFSKNHLEMMLLDLDQWEAEHTQKQALDIVSVIRTVNWLLKHPTTRHPKRKRK